MMPCESWPARLAPIDRREIVSASPSGVPAAISKERAISVRRSGVTFGIGLSFLPWPPLARRLGAVSAEAGELGRRPIRGYSRRPEMRLGFLQINATDSNGRHSDGAIASLRRR